jgi:GMP synthase (glutamine-hydrolysing)
VTKTALIIRHVPYEGIAGFRDPIEQDGFVLDRIDVADPAFAQVDLVQPDLVILMGGPMGVYDREEHPWIGCEIERLRHRLEADRPTLGVCLGAQMIAAALGARVYPGPHEEIGFHPIDLTPAGNGSPLDALGDTPVLHWHGDTFDLPDGTEWLASSARYPHQAFRRGTHLLALQFHAEMGIDPRIDHWIANSADSLAALGTDGVTMRADYDRLGPACVNAGRAMIARWLQELA